MAQAESFHFPEGYPELLEQMGHIIGKHLITLGLPSQIANARALAITDDIRKDLGGQQLYISKGQEYELSLRDREIYDKFDGRNYHKLAHEYSLSEMQVRNIVKRGLAADRASKQGSLL